MQTVRTPEQEDSPARQDLTQRAWGLIAAGALLGSAVLQLIASLERWVTVSNGWSRTDSTVEDHTFDYYLPADPWENLASTAHLFGLGFVLLGVGVFAAAHMTRRPGAASGPGAANGPGAASGPGVARSIGMGSRPVGPHRSGRGFDNWLAVVVAAAFVVFGGHALVSGLIGAPTVLQYGYLPYVLALLQIVGLIVLGMRALPRSPLVSLTCLVLLGVTFPGYIAATFGIAPALVGYQSHDTTPYTETILAVFTAAAAVPLLLAALRRRGHGANILRPTIERS